MYTKLLSSCPGLAASLVDDFAAEKRSIPSLSVSQPQSFRDRIYAKYKLVLPLCALRKLAPEPPSSTLGQKDFLALLVARKIDPLDLAVLGTNAKWAEQLKRNVADAFLLSRIRLSEQERAVWAAVSYEVLPNLLPRAEIGRFVALHLTVPCEGDDTEFTKLRRAAAVLAVSEELRTLEGEKAEFALISLFVLVSPFYHPPGKFVSEEYSPIWRDGIRKFLKLLTKQGFPAEFSRFRAFEAELFRLIPHAETAKYNPTAGRSLRMEVIAEYTPSTRQSVCLANAACVPALTSEQPFEFLDLNLAPSPHSLYCIAGFLTEKDNHRESWDNLLLSDPDEFIQAVIWPSGHSPEVEKWCESKDFADKFASVIGIAKYAVSGRMKDEFLAAEKRAEDTGTLLACLLAKRFACGQRCISLVGHSLGTVTIMKCLKVLSSLESQRGERSRYIVQDVLLMGGAAVIDEEKENLEEEYFSVVAGRVFNCYMAGGGDGALRAFQWVKDLQPIGAREIVHESKEGRKKVRNFDVSGIVKGHTEYRENVSKIMKLVGFC